jgi:hypothetical protein
MIRQLEIHATWTEITLSQDGQSGGTGFVRVKDRNEVGKLYGESGVLNKSSRNAKGHSAFLTDGSGQNRRLCVHLFDMGRSPSHLIAHTCTAMDVCTVEERPIEIPDPTIHTTLEQTMQPSDPKGWSEVNIGDQESSHTHRQPLHITTPLRIHINISGGAFETRAHGIFVTNINLKASSRDLREHFNRAGRITECLLQRDRSTGRVKGNATLWYASLENVRKAVGMFDGKPFIGRRLRVRVDKVFAVSNPPPTPKPQVDGGVGEDDILWQSTGEDGPVIVNGS